MRTVREVLTTGGTLLTALLVLLSNSVAQDTRPTLTTLYSFAGGSDGSDPLAGVVIGPGGVLYGTTQLGGTSNNGTVFSLTPPAAPGGPWTETLLHSFAGSPDDGANPQEGVVISGAGILYGTTVSGGLSDCIFEYCGTAFSLKPPASPGGAWTETVLYRFNNSIGSNPEGSLVIGSGVLYGTTSLGGTASNGTVFSLTPPTSSGGAWTETVLHDFTPLSGDGGGPEAGVAIGSGGVLYGTTFFDGLGSGTVFSLTPPASPGGSWTETVLYNFGSTVHDGLYPMSAVVIGDGGVLYGTTQDGGSTSGSCGFMGCGTVFVLTPPGSAGGAWTESILHYFNSTDGAEPFAGVVIGRGALYGTTAYGGTANSGTVFSLTP